MRARGAAGVADLVLLVLDRSRPLEDVDRALMRETAASPRIVVVNKIDLPPAWHGRRACGGLVRDRVSGFGIREVKSKKREARSRREGGRFARRLAAAKSSGAASSRWPQRSSGCPNREVPKSPNPEQDKPVLVSLKTGAGLDELRAAMREALDVAEPLRDEPMVTNVRHEALLRQAHEAIRRAMANLEEAGESASEELVLADLADARGALEEVTGKRTTEDVLRRIFERFCIGK